MPASVSTCPKCGSEKIIPRVHVKDRNDDSFDQRLTAVVDEYPKARVFKSPIESTLRANICGNCGFVEFYADSPGALWRAYERANGSKT